MNHFRFFLIVTLFFAVSLISCVSSKQVVYFNNLTDTTTAGLGNAQSIFETPIQKNDLLSITVGGSNPEDLISLNSGSGYLPGTSATGTVLKSVGYLVESDGKIQLPFLGKVQAEGVTRLQLENTLTSRFRDYTKNPVVNIKFLNYGYSVLGEVAHPGRFEMDNERTTILEALSMANDMTIFGKRDNVLIIREVNGKREFGRLNLLSKNIFKSPYFYLKTNDVVYVEPLNTKFISRSSFLQYFSPVIAGVTLLLTVLNYIKL
jgi:polysaccharide export outer membrane protein